MRAGMSPGVRKSGASTSMMRENGGAAAAMSTISSQESNWPSAAHVRRHSWTSQRPVMFFSKRIVPQTPPSLVKLKRQAVSLMTGSGLSTPISDHVPELR